MKTKLTLLALSLGTVACGSGEPGRVQTDGPPVDVTVTMPILARAVVTYPAEVSAKRVADIATRMSGTVMEVHVDVGSRVSAGDRLVSLDARDVTARVGGARAALELAEKSHGRIERLADGGAASEQELDASAARLEAARSMLAEAQAQEAYAVVTAPFAGVVTDRRVDTGDLANPGVPLLSMVDARTTDVVAELPAALMGVVTEGAVLDVSTAESVVPARVDRVVPALAGGGRTFRAELTPLEPLVGAYPGAYARVHVSSEDADTRWIPADAFFNDTATTEIYTIEGDVLRLRWVRLGARRADAVELLAGPPGTPSVVRRPSADLADGRSVASVREEAWVAGRAPSGGATR
jgi:RND family efflux transporter MFP subunit